MSAIVNTSDVRIIVLKIKGINNYFTQRKRDITDSDITSCHALLLSPPSTTFLRLLIFSLSLCVLSFSISPPQPASPSSPPPLPFYALFSLSLSVSVCLSVSLSPPPPSPSVSVLIHITVDNICLVSCSSPQSPFHHLPSPTHLQSLSLCL